MGELNFDIEMKRRIFKLVSYVGQGANPLVLPLSLEAKETQPLQKAMAESLWLLVL